MIKPLLVPSDEWAQASLWYNAEHHARRDDPQTSHQAAEEHESVNGWHCRTILTVLRAAGIPLAAEEIADATEDMDTVAVAKRFCDLLRANQIERTAERHTNRSGRQAFKVRLK